MEVLTVRVLDVQTKPFIPQAKAQSYKFPPDFYVPVSERGDYGDSVS